MRQLIVLISVFFLTACVFSYQPRISVEERSLIEGRYAELMQEFEAGDPNGICNAAGMIAYFRDGRVFGSKAERKALFIDHIKRGTTLANTLKDPRDGSICSLILLMELQPHHRPNFIKRNNEMGDCMSSKTPEGKLFTAESYDACAAELNYEP